jgi:nucleotide-binding universal stress UspA family protein
MSRIVVGVDGSNHADLAVQWAVREAEVGAAEVELVYGYAHHPHAAMLSRSDRDRAAARLDKIVRRNQPALDRVKWFASAVPMITRPASALRDVGGGADLIVVGSRGLGGFQELLLGATSYRTATHAPVPVAVIRGSETAVREGTRGIVVGVDGSLPSRRALRWALDEAARWAVDVVAVHAYDSSTDLAQATMMSNGQRARHRERLHDAAVAVIDAAMARADIPDGLNVHRVVMRGPAAALLCSHAGPDQLLVVGTHGRGALGRMAFGAVSHQCLHHATGPVVVVP